MDEAETGLEPGLEPGLGADGEPEAAVDTDAAGDGETEPGGEAAEGVAGRRLPGAAHSGTDAAPAARVSAAAAEADAESEVDEGVGAKGEVGSGSADRSGAESAPENDEPGSGDTDTAPESEAGSAAEPGVSRAADDAPEADGARAAEAVATSDVDSAPAADADAAPEPGETAEASRGAVAASRGGGSGSEPGSGPEPGSAREAGEVSRVADSRPDADEADAAGGSAGSARDVDESGGARDHAGSEAAAGEPTGVDDGDAPAGPPAVADESRPGGKEAADDGGAEEPAVDQPTAVFKAPRPPAVDQPTTMLKLGDAKPPAQKADDGPSASKADAEPSAPKDDDGPSASKADAEPSDPAGDAKPPAVDQPTTMLKLGDAKPPAPKADAKPSTPKADDGPSAPKADAERASKFVALKPLDEPPARSTPSWAAAGAPDAPAPKGGVGISPAEATRAIPQVGPERTTQQPLPPKPPLDLLAELTNTPPPRQTPVRTIIRRVKIWTPLVALLVIVFAVVQAVRPLPAPTLALTADESYAFKGEKVSLPWPGEGQGAMDVNGIGTMDTFGEQKPVAIGSVAKAMTAYVILKDHPMKSGEKGATIEVDAKGETEGGYDKDGESTLNTVKEGDKLSQYDAIAAIMIPSANNIARLLARWDSNGSEEAFVKKMNAAAKELGMTNTKYTDPSGLKETTVSTAADQVKLGNELVKIQALVDITKLPEWKDPSGQKWRNYNTLVPFDGAIGIKTGSTTAAGGNLLFAANKEVGGETVTVVGAVLGQHTPPIIDTVNAVSKTAMLAAQDALIASTILKKGDVVGYVDDGLGGRTPVVVTKDVSAIGWAGETVELKLDAVKTIPHAAKAGTKVGSLAVGDGSGDGVEVPVALKSALTEPGFPAKVTRVS
ncbi:D-alanyl-D-alanine carboxypeptidase [Streptomyces graminofaciens]|uniref:D-alanyl-D-alanine carboxypeptidase n=1 Tax=Streptomyces graminofaciens TaxID=68212 RepID=UPI003D9AF40C